MLALFSNLVLFALIFLFVGFAHPVPSVYSIFATAFAEDQVTADATASTESASPTDTQKQEKKTTLLSDDLLNIRDPFKKPATQIAQEDKRSALEKYPADAFRLVGVLTGPNRLKAMLIDPQGVTHFVTERAKIGTRGGQILKISPERILVREKIVNLVGQEENSDTEILMSRMSEKKAEAQGISQFQQR